MKLTRRDLNRLIESLLLEQTEKIKMNIHIEIQEQANTIVGIRIVDTAYPQTATEYSDLPSSLLAQTRGTVEGIEDTPENRTAIKSELQPFIYASGAAIIISKLFAESLAQNDFMGPAVPTPSKKFVGPPSEDMTFMDFDIKFNENIKIISVGKTRDSMNPGGRVALSTFETILKVLEEIAKEASVNPIETFRKYSKEFSELMQITKFGTRQIGEYSEEELKRIGEIGKSNYEKSKAFTDDLGRFDFDPSRFELPDLD